MDNFISIFVSSGLNPVFVKANADLIRKNTEAFSALDKLSESYNLEMFKILENLWYEKYGAKIIKDSEGWKTLEFDTVETKSLFSLKWSG